MRPRLLLLAAVALLPLCAGGAELPPCQDGKMFQCGRRQICDQAQGRCRCLPEFVFDPGSGECAEKAKDDGQHDDHSILAPVAVVVCLTLLCLGAVFVARRRGLVDSLRQRIARRDNSMMYEDVMIGQDDPPLAA